MFLQKFEYGDAALHFTQSPSKNGKKTVGLSVLPKGAPEEPKGTSAPLFYAEFSDGTSLPVKVIRQVQFLSGSLNSYLADENGTEFVQKLVFDRDTGVFTLNFRYENRGKEEKLLRYFSAFSFGAKCGNGVKIYRMGAAYSYAYALKCESMEELGLGFEKSPALSFGRDFRFLPFLAVQTEEGVLALRLDAPDKFEITLRRAEGENLELFGGERFGGKTIPAGGSFETSKVHFTFQKDITSALQALCRRMQKKLSSDEEFIVCSSEGVSLGSMKKFAALLKEIQVPTVLLEAGKKTWSDEEMEGAEKKLAVEGVRAERSLQGLFPMPEFERAGGIAAANLSRILPAAKLISTFSIRAEEAERDTIFHFCAACFARIKLKGELLKLSEEQIILLKSLLSFYGRISKIVGRGDVTICKFDGTISDEPCGTQFFEKVFEDEKLLVACFYGAEGSYKIPLEGYELVDKISTAPFTVRGDVLRISGAPFDAGAFLLKRKES